MSAELRCIRCGGTFAGVDEVATVIAWSAHECQPSGSWCRHRSARLTPAERCIGGGTRGSAVHPSRFQP